MAQEKGPKESLLATVAPSKAIIKLAVPATLALLAKAVYNIVDTAYIGLLAAPRLWRVSRRAAPSKGVRLLDVHCRAV